MNGYFSVYWDAQFPGEIWLELDNETEHCDWKTNDTYLNGCLSELGDFIEQIKAEDD